MKYSLEFKKSAVQKYLTRGNRPVKEILKELNVPSASIYQWCNDFAKVSGMKKQSSPHTRTALEKLNSIMEFNSLPENKRGEFLRKNGLSDANINEWLNQIKMALSQKNIPSENKNDIKKVKELEQELRRKDKALAEASALLILKKKANLIWGQGEEE